MSLEEKPCELCGKIYKPYLRKSYRCKECANNKRVRIVGEAPLCLCGCGEKTEFCKTYRKWNKYVHGHFGAQQSRLGLLPHVEAWNKGTAKIRFCRVCSNKIESYDQTRKYCSKECSAKDHSGDKSTRYRGKNNKRTKYEMCWVTGRRAKFAVRKHIIVMEKHLNRRLNNIEVVHHIDENGLNNNLNNLHLFHCDSCHNYFHSKKFEGNPIELVYRYPEVHDILKSKVRAFKRREYDLDSIDLEFRNNQ